MSTVDDILAQLSEIETRIRALQAEMDYATLLNVQYFRALLAVLNYSKEEAIANIARTALMKPPFDTSKADALLAALADAIRALEEARHDMTWGGVGNIAGCKAAIARGKAVLHALSPNDAELAPGHTDLMVAPETIGPWLAENPLPPDPTIHPNDEGLDGIDHSKLKGRDSDG